MRQRFEFHASGITYIVLMALVAVAAMNTQNNLLFWVLGVMAGGLIISAWLSMAMLGAIEIRRLDPRHGTVGQPLFIRYEVTNRRRLFPAFDLMIEELPAPGASSWRRLMPATRTWIMHVGPRETVHGENVYWPERRGVAEFDEVRIRTTFPLGIIRRRLTVTQPQHTLIYPMMFELQQRVLKAMTSAAVLGSKVSARAGAGEDYFGLREFRPGDSLRHVSWKRTAIRDELVSIDRTSPSPTRLRIVLDLTPPPETPRIFAPPKARDADEQAREGVRIALLEERSIMLAASILRAADLEGYEVGLSVLGVDVPATDIRRSHYHFQRIMGTLAAVNLEETRTPTRPRTTWDAERAAMVVIHPEHAHAMSARSDALHLTATQFESLVGSPIGVPVEPAHEVPAARDSVRVNPDGAREATA